MNKRRLVRELKEIRNNPHPDYHMEPIAEENIYHWQGTLFGPSYSSYSGGIFFLEIKFPIE